MKLSATISGSKTETIGTRASRESELVYFSDSVSLATSHRPCSTDLSIEIHVGEKLLYTITMTSQQLLKLAADPRDYLHRFEMNLAPGDNNLRQPFISFRITNVMDKKTSVEVPATQTKDPAPAPFLARIQFFLVNFDFPHENLKVSKSFRRNYSNCFSPVI